MPKRKSVLHLRITTKSKKVMEEWNKMSQVEKRALIRQMLMKRKAINVPVACSDGSSCSITPNSQVGQEMKGIDPFILEEVSMIS